VKLFFQKINQLLSGFCGWLMIGMMLLLVVDIIGRTINKPLQGMAELSVFVMMIVIYFGLARCEQHQEHVGLELVANALPHGVKRMHCRLELKGLWLFLPTCWLSSPSVCCSMRSPKTPGRLFKTTNLFMVLPSSISGP